MCATSDESESEHTADEGFEYALRAKARLEKAEYLEVRIMIMHAYIGMFVCIYILYTFESINLLEKKTRGR